MNMAEGRQEVCTAAQLAGGARRVITGTGEEPFVSPDRNLIASEGQSRLFFFAPPADLGRFMARPSHSHSHPLEILKRLPKQPKTQRLIGFCLAS